MSRKISWLALVALGGLAIGQLFAQVPALEGTAAMRQFERNRRNMKEADAARKDAPPSRIDVLEKRVDRLENLVETLTATVKRIEKGGAK